MAEQGPRVVTLNDYLRILKRRRWTIVAGAIAGLVAALMFSLLTSDGVEASSSPVSTDVQPPSPAASSIPATGPQAEILLTSVSPTVSAGTITPSLLTENQLISSTMVAERVADDIGGALEVPELMEGLHVTQVEGSEIIAISFAHEDVELAADVANSFAENYLELRTERIGRAIQTETRNVAKRILALRQQRSRIERDLIDAQAAGQRGLARSLLADRQIVAAKLVQLQDELLVLSESNGAAPAGEIVNPALATEGSETSEVATSPTPVTTTSGSPSARDLFKDALAGLILGAIVGAALALLQEYLSERFGDRREIQEVLGAPVLAGIPNLQGGNGADGYVSLRAKLEHHIATSDNKMLLVTSPRSGDGKTTTVLNLGREMAAAGHRVLLVSGDLSSPDLDRRLQCDSSNGLSAWLTRTGSDPVPVAISDAGGQPGLRLLPAGGSSDGTVRDRALKELFSELSRGDDQLVLVDSAAAGDPITQLMAVHAAQALLVIDASVRQNEALQAKRELEALGAELVGVVVNREVGR